MRGVSSGILRRPHVPPTPRSPPSFRAKARELQALVCDKGISLIAVNGVAEDDCSSETGSGLTQVRKTERMLALMANGRLRPGRAITHRNALHAVFEWTDVKG